MIWESVEMIGLRKRYGLCRQHTRELTHGRHPNARVRQLDANLAAGAQVREVSAVRNAVDCQSLPERNTRRLVFGHRDDRSRPDGTERTESIETGRNDSTARRERQVQGLGIFRLVLLLRISRSETSHPR